MPSGDGERLSEGVKVKTFSKDRVLTDKNLSCQPVVTCQRKKCFACRITCELQEKRKRKKRRLRSVLGEGVTV